LVKKVKKDKDENGNEIEEEVFAEEDNRDDKEGDKEKGESDDAGTFFLLFSECFYPCI
jgi:hypothetical protein